METRMIDENACQGMIVLFTSNSRGGIMHFTIQLGSTLSLLGFDVVIYIPDNSQAGGTNEKIEVVNYRKYKNLSLKSKASIDLAKEIERLNPILVLFTDPSLVSSQVLLSLDDNIATALCIHDVVPHIETLNLYNSLKGVMEKIRRGYLLQRTRSIILLSENSINQFTESFPLYVNKVAMMPLGAHVPVAEHIKPPELDDLRADCSYYLFFGRITKYKGIIRLLHAYQAITTEKPLLIIAGGGELQPEEKSLIANDNNVLLINRFIEDGEMLYLIINSLAVVLPYIEATQSGVLPIAYHFRVPVITSNVSGLVEFVENGVTGTICNDVEELTLALKRIRNKEYRNCLGDGAYAFYQERLDWSNNVIRCIKPMIQR